MSSPPESNLDRVRNRYRAQLLATEADAVFKLGNAYQDAWNALDGRVQSIATDLINADLDERAFAVFREERLRTLQVALVREMDTLGEFAEAVITEQQRAGLMLGRNYAVDVIQAAYGDIGLEMAQLNRLPVEQMINMVGNLENGSPLRRLTDALGPDASRRVRTALLNGVAMSLNPREVARQTRDAFGGNLSRALTVSRTEMLRVHRQAVIDHYDANSDIVVGWRWQAALDERTCMACVVMHGKIFPTKSGFGTHPNCRCTASPVPPRSRLKVEDGTDWFARQNEDVQMRMMGPEYHAAWKRGDFKLDDLVNVVHSKEWGTTRTVKSLSALGVKRQRITIPKDITRTDVTAIRTSAIRRAPTPTGPTVSGKITTMLEAPGGKLKKPITDALLDIDRVHAVPDALAVLGKIKAYTSANGAEGRYTYLRSGKPVGIEVNRSAIGPRITTAHEVGHFLDHQAIARPGQFATAGSPGSMNAQVQSAMASLKTSIDNSDAIKRMNAIKAAGGKTPDPRITIPRQYLDYAIDDKETFARAYSQYIAVRSKDSAMLSELQVLRSNAVHTSAGVHLQWEDADFVPIAEAFDRLFRALGWLR
jgi:SPP1 gp7 family putative phage head morphogenesis protein